MNCKTCNEELDQSWTECPCCETPKGENILCGNCGAELKSHWKKCPECKTQTCFENKYSKVNSSVEYQKANSFENQILTPFEMVLNAYANLKTTQSKKTYSNDETNANLYFTGKISDSEEITFKAIPAIGNNGAIVSLLVNECFKTPIDKRLSEGFKNNNNYENCYETNTVTIIEENETDLGENNENIQSTGSLKKLELKPGQKLVEQFKIKKKIGTGGFANVYQAEHMALGEDIAIKAMSSFGNLDVVLSFLVKEYKTQLKIVDRKHICRSEAPIKFKKNDVDWVILPMELAHKSFRQWLNENDLNEEDRIEQGIEIIKQICSGVDAIHNAELIHMDLKPENILLQKDPTKEDYWIVKISDFGLTRSLDKLSGINHEFLQEGVGTPAYMSPEQIFAARWKDVTKSADIYAIGIMLYELLDGDLPYSGSSSQIKLKKQDKEIVISPPKGPKHYVNVAMSCLERDVKRRPKNGKEIIERLLKKEQRNIFYQRPKIEFSTDIGISNKRTFTEVKSILGNKLDEYKFIPKVVDTGKFNIGQYPVTFEQFDYYCEQTGAIKPNDEGWGRKDRPVINITYHEAVKYCNWLNQITGRNFRLPSEEEWLFAATSGKKSNNLNYSGSNNLSEVGWFKDNSKNKTQPVGQKKPNGINAYDMTGNTWEWCDNWYDKDKTLKVIRGGAWNSFSNYCSIYLRYWNKVGNGLDMISFRVLEDTQWSF